MPELTDPQPEGGSQQVAADEPEQLRAEVAALRAEVAGLQAQLLAEREEFASEIRLGAVEVAGMEREITRHYETRAAIQRQLRSWTREYERLLATGTGSPAKSNYRKVRRKAKTAAKLVARRDPRLERLARRVRDSVRKG